MPYRRQPFTDDRLAALYKSESFGGETTMRARVIRELIDELRHMRAELAEARALLEQHSGRRREGAWSVGEQHAQRALPMGTAPR